MLVHAGPVGLVGWGAACGLIALKLAGFEGLAGVYVCRLGFEEHFQRPGGAMSRFKNLEFGDQYEDQTFQQSKGLKDGAFYLGQAKVAFANGNFETALRFFSKVLEFDPQNVEAWAGQVRMLIELGEYREAQLWAEKALERFPREPELLAAKAVALARSGSLEEALACSDASIEERGDAPYLWLARGDVMLARKESRAEYCLEKAMLMSPHDWFTAWLAARIRYLYKQFALALKLMQKALELNATHFLVWLELGRCQLALGLAGPALRSFHQARELNPDSVETRQAITEAAHGTGFFGRLRGLWRRTAS